MHVSATASRICIQLSRRPTCTPELWDALCSDRPIQQRQQQQHRNSSHGCAACRADSILLRSIVVVTYLRGLVTSSYVIMAMSYAEDYFCNWPTSENAESYALNSYNSPGKLTDVIFCSVRGATCLKPSLHVKHNYFEIILKLFQCFISHVTTPETE